VSINRLSFAETPNILSSLGFLNRISLFFHAANENVLIQKGSLIFGFRDGNNNPYGFLYDHDIELTIPTFTGKYYITVNSLGVVDIETGNFNNVRGLGANITGIPWYTYNNKALVGKIFRTTGIITGCVVCDDAYWCEFEGVF